MKRPQNEERMATLVYTMTHSGDPGAWVRAHGDQVCDGTGMKSREASWAFCNWFRANQRWPNRRLLSVSQRRQRPARRSALLLDEAPPTGNATPRAPTPNVTCGQVLGVSSRDSRSIRPSGRDAMPSPGGLSMSKRTKPPISLELLKRDTWHLFDVMEDEQPLSFVLMVTSFVEHSLTLLLSGFLIDGDTSRGLFSHKGGILDSVFSKVKMAYCLGLIDKPLFNNLQRIGEIRNLFALACHDRRFARDGRGRCVDDHRVRAAVGCRPLRLSRSLSPPTLAWKESQDTRRIDVTAETCRRQRPRRS